ncbi:hypothetical protein BGW42_007764 [Actinomortierella wolfii]|nr:hypothetical protein BGW42_007764 [Actinomortierella wolfii]
MIRGVTEKGPSEVLPISDIKSLEWVTNRNYRKKRALDIRDCDFEPFAERNRTLVIRTNPKQYLDGTHVIVFHMLHPEETYAEAHDISWAHYEFTRVVVGASKNAEEPYLLIGRGCLGIYRCTNARSWWHIRHYRFRKAEAVGGTCEALQWSSVVNDNSGTVELENVPDWKSFRTTARACGQDFIVVDFHGPHTRHGVTPKPAPTFAGKQALCDLIARFPYMKPKALLTGDACRLPARFLDPAFCDDTYFRGLVQRLKKKMHFPEQGLTLEQSLKFDDTRLANSILDHRFESGDCFVAFQSDLMRSWLVTKKPFMADAVHGVFDLRNRSTAASAVFCSAYNEVLKKSLGYQSWKELLENFPGIIVDYSSSQEQGFSCAIRGLYPEIPANIDIRVALCQEQTKM